MDAIFSPIFKEITLLMVAVLRLSMALICLPLMGGSTVPPLLRNTLIVCFGLIIVTFKIPSLYPESLIDWVKIIAHELFIGTVIGLQFGAVFWACKMAGELIDTKAGATTGQLSDPFTGGQITLNGAFLGQVAVYVFIYSGGLLSFVGVLLRSYVLWPISNKGLSLIPTSLHIFEDDIQIWVTLGVVFSAPAIVFLFLVDTGLGLANRVAQQLNVFQMSHSLKTWLATFIILLSLAAIIQRSVTEIVALPNHILQILRHTIPSPMSKGLIDESAIPPLRPRL